MAEARAARIRRHIGRLGSASQPDACQAERTLIRWYRSEATPQLLVAARSPSPKVRCRAAWILGQVGGDGAFEALAELISDADPAVRYDSLVALGALGDPRGVAILVAAALRRDSSADDGAAAMGLARLMPTGRAVVVEMARDTDPERQRLAAYVLDCCEMTDHDTYDALVSLISVDDGEVQERAIHALGRWRDASSLALALRLLECRAPVVRAGAVEWLAVAGEPAAPEAVERAMADPAAEVRLSACRSASQMGSSLMPDRRLATLLAPAVTDACAEVRQFALLELVGRLSHRTYVPIVADAIAGSEHVGAEVAALLGGRLAAPLAERLLACLGAARNPVYRDAITRRLDDPAPRVRRAAERAIALLGAG